MADIRVSNGERAVVTILDTACGTGHFWVCACGEQSEREEGMADTINDAEVHVDRQCRYRD